MSFPAASASVALAGHLHPDAAIGFDIGGTNLRAAVVNPDGSVLSEVAYPTPTTEVQLESAIVEIVRHFHDISGTAMPVGLAVAGFVDQYGEVVRFAPHLPWRDAPVRQRIAERLGVPVFLEHDANSAAWGEWRFGAGRGVAEWVYFAVGTGIGAAIMSRGEIYRGAFGTAPEFGHIVVQPHGLPCPCGKRGCLERYASGTALPDIAARLSPHFAQEPEVTLGQPATGAEIAAAARGGDPLAVAVMAEFSHWLGLGLGLVTDILDPELIVIGGGAASDADLFLDSAQHVMAGAVVGAGHRQLPRLSTGALGSAAGMIGVSDLARRQ